MDVLHRRLHLDRGQSVVVTLHRQANVTLMDDHNFGRYKTGQDFKYFGGTPNDRPLRYQRPVLVIGPSLLILAALAGRSGIQLLWWDNPPGKLSGS
jgi:Domain of unknown function (DUF1883)